MLAGYPVVMLPGGPRLIGASAPAAP